MPIPARTEWLTNFRGLNDATIPGSQRRTSIAGGGISEEFSGLTQDLKNVKVRFGVVSGRGGLASYQTTSDSANTPIIGLAQYSRAQGASNILVRMTPTKLEWLNGSTWTDITGTALTGTSTTRPQFDTIQDTLVFTNEGEDRPRKYTGSGNSAVLGGTPPFAKAIAAYVGYLVLGNVSDDGSFTDVLHGWRVIRWSSDFDNSWTICAGGQIGSLNEIEINDTAGDILAMHVLGRDLIIYKTDGIVKLTWVGGQLVFRKDKFPMNIGLAGPLAIASVGEAGHIFLGNDSIIYLLTSNEIRPLSEAALSRTLPTTSTLARFKFARAFTLEDQGLYVLLYDRTSLSGQLLDSYVTYNYRSGEFTKGELGASVIAGLGFRPTAGQNPIPLISTSANVMEWDNFDNVLDVAASVDRYWTTGWQQFADEEGYLHGVRAVFRKSKDARVKISIATDLRDSYSQERSFTLQGSSSADDFVECEYKLPAPVFARWANVKVRQFHDAADAETNLLRLGFIVQPLHPTAEATSGTATALPRKN